MSKNIYHNDNNDDIKHIAIYGPTASGKSMLAMQYAIRNNGVIVNFDSQQIYHEIPIITAQPSREEQKAFEHRLYGYVDYEKQYNFNLWLHDVTKQIKELLNKRRPIIAVGGTGLYLNALLRGAISMPTLDIDQLMFLRDLYSIYNNAELYQKLQKWDPEYAKSVDPNDRQRIFRALAFCEIEKKKYSEFRKKENVQNPFLEGLKFHKIYINPPRAELYKKINNRFEEMLKNGAIEEVKALYKKNPYHNFSKATGVKEIIAYLENRITYGEMLEKSQQLTRNYAKRQCTWFNNQIKADEIIDQIVE